VVASLDPEPVSKSDDAAERKCGEESDRVRWRKEKEVDNQRDGGNSVE
jgi:hypothetical protein